MHPGRKIFLIGFMGSGKSTLGKKLASHLGWSFIDLDKKIEAETGMKIPEIFSVKGEPWFREKEASMLHGLADEKNTVISTGGGAPCFGDNMEFMIGAGLTVYLRLSPAQLKDRLMYSTTERPLISNIKDKDLFDFISEKLEEREKWYSRAAIIIDGFKSDDSSVISFVSQRIQQ